ncbi:hypothetical protein GAGA_4739 [Paraglaciecola agarilytica NO2]|uniref:Uncharacterized protein n=1 Tax=Paraglaciecola agarilytica NO2 TaxID=1125747 RepID=A0ABQ0IE57_9ALTE|nr:hypothetical protein GAGA_4739 [Paraglaciecola agarilytica NO2]
MGVAFERIHHLLRASGVAIVFFRTRWLTLATLLKGANA